MKYLNLGCGTHYSNDPVWTNIDFVSSGPGVIAHNLLAGIPFADNSFDLVYHSHVLEHFTKEDGRKLISECFRVLKTGGVLRIAIPDLERIAREYLKWLEKGLQEPENRIASANYEWMLIEMYDQTVRNISGGNMGKYLFQEKIPNEDFVFDRIGEEGRQLRNGFLNAAKNNTQVNNPVQKAGLIFRIKQRLRTYLLHKLHVNNELYEIGRFRTHGEIHQWMYDRYSLMRLLTELGGKDFKVMTAFTSNIQDWKKFNLDGKNEMVRKPDSLFVEVIKK